MSELLRVANVNKRFPGVNALQDVHFDLKKEKFMQSLGTMAQENQHL